MVEFWNSEGIFGFCSKTVGVDRIGPPGGVAAYDPFAEVIRFVRRYMEELYLLFHNSRGLADEVKRRNYFREILALSDIAGLCETNASSDPAKNFSAFAEAAASDPQLACDVWWTQGLTASTGMALVVKRSLRATDVQKIYDDGTGHTLVVDLTVNDKLKLRIVLSHAPPQSGQHGNALRQQYFERLAAEPLLAAPHGRIVIWGGDFNMVELPEYDGIVGSTDTRIQATARWCERCALP